MLLAFLCHFSSSSSGALDPVTSRCQTWLNTAKLSLPCLLSLNGRTTTRRGTRKKSCLHGLMRGWLDTMTPILSTPLTTSMLRLPKGLSEHTPRHQQLVWHASQVSAWGDIWHLGPCHPLAG